MKDLQKRIEAMESELASIKEAAKEEHYPVLSLNATAGGNLEVVVTGADQRACVVAHITPSGQLHALDTEHRRKAFGEWLDSGPSKVDTKSVEWRGKPYKISRGGLFLADTPMGCIYNFAKCAPCEGCVDGNVIRHPYNGTPILFS